MQFRIVIQCESEEANALALDYLFLGIGSESWFMDARLRDYIIRMEIFGAVEVERECLLLCEEKKQVMPPLRVFSGL